MLRRVGSGRGHLGGQQLALVDDGVRGERADVGVLVVVALPHPRMLDQLPQHEKLRCAIRPSAMTTSWFHYLDHIFHKAPQETLSGRSMLLGRGMTGKGHPGGERRRPVPLGLASW